MSLAARILAADPARRATVPALRYAVRRWPDRHLVQSAVFHVGADLARRHPLITGSLRTGSPIVLDLRDPAHRQIMFEGLCEQPTTRLLHRLAFPGWTVLDVGANAGYYSLLAYDLGGRTSRIYAFEPNPVTVAMLRASVEGAGADATVHVCEAACGASCDTAELHMSEDPAEHAFSTLDARLAWSPEWPTIAVDVIDLDSYCADNGILPDVVKIDSEGYELEVLEGMASLLARRLPRYLICEAVKGYGRPDPAVLTAALAEHGYDSFRIADDGNLARDGRPQEIENICFVAPGQPVA